MKSVIYATTDYLPPLKGSALLIGGADHSQPGNWFGEYLIALPGSRYPMAYREKQMFNVGEGWEELLPNEETEARRMLELARCILELELAKLDSNYFRDVYLPKNRQLVELDLRELKRGRMLRTWTADFDWIKHHTLVSSLRNDCQEILTVPQLYREVVTYELD